MSASDIPDVVKKNVRAVLLSKIGGVVASQFLKDYRTLVQEKLNYVQYGFHDIEGFINAIPEYARFEYSQKEMAYKIFGVGDPNTYMSMAAKKAQGSVAYSDSKRNGIPETDDAKKLVPNSYGLYTLCFKIELVESTDKEYLKKKFGDVGEIGEINLTSRWVFIRYRTKSGALAALQKYSSDYDMHVADEKKKTGKSVQQKNTTKNDGCFNCTSPGHKASECPLPWASECFNCKEFGHKASNCPQAKGTGKNGTKKKKDLKDDKGLCVFVGNISHSKSEEEFRKLIDNYNHKNCHVVVKENKIFAFVTVESENDAQALIKGLHLFNFGGKELKVSMSEKQKTNQQQQNLPNSIKTPSWTSLPVNAETSYHTDSSSLCSTHNSYDSDVSFSNFNIQIGADGDKKVISTAVNNGVVALSGSYGGCVTGGGGGDCISHLDDVYADMPELEDIEDIEDIEDDHLDSDGEEIDPVKIFVGNFPAGTTEKELKSLFWVYGVLKVDVINSAMNNKCTKAYVWLPTAKKARDAIAGLNQKNYYGCYLLVDAPKFDSVSKEKILGYNSNTENSSIITSATEKQTRTFLSDSEPEQVIDLEDLANFNLKFKLESFPYFIDKMKAWNNTIEPGMRIEVFVSTVENDDTFWGQVISEKEQMIKLAMITEELQKSSSRLSPTRGLGRCAAKFGNEWYRAWIIKVFSEHNKVLVFFLDYGNTSIVNYEDAQFIPSKFWNLPPRCRPFKIISKCPKNLKELESEVIECQVISSASSAESFMTEIVLHEKK